MSIIAVNAPGERVSIANTVECMLPQQPIGGAITIMTHGFRYCPFTPEADPHTRLFSPQQRKSSWKSVSWAHYLHLNRPDAGLGIGFGWPGLGRIDQAAQRAFAAGRALGAMVADIHRTRPDLRLRIIAHSLGARVALQALQEAPPDAIETLVLLSGAEFRPKAEHAMAAPGARSTRVVNVTSRENLAFDTLFRLFAPERHLLSPMLSSGLGQGQPRWLDLRIDNPSHLATLRGLGYRPANPSHPVCHWSSFLRPGLFPLYRDLLGAEGAARFAELATGLARAKAATARPIRQNGLRLKYPA